MIKEVLGIERIRMLYLQLLYRCNFDCIFCYHGERLKWRDGYTLAEAKNLLHLLRTEYDLQAITLLGGEPFVYKNLAEVLRYAKEDLDLTIDICTNAYRIEKQLRQSGRHIDLLRVSLDGMRELNDRLRREGSFASAMRGLELARELGVTTSGTMTVNSWNVDDVVPLAYRLQEAGVSRLNLHSVRVVGNAEEHPELALDAPSFARIHEVLETLRNAADLRIELRLDPDLETGTVEGDKSCEIPIEGDRLDRIEADPRGGLSCSCFAVGNDRNAFWYDKAANRIEYRPTDQDEVAAYLSAKA